MDAVMDCVAVRQSLQRALRGAVNKSLVAVSFSIKEDRVELFYYLDSLDDEGIEPLLVVTSEVMADMPDFMQINEGFFVWSSNEKIEGNIAFLRASN
jgi:hypothetical protein